MLNVNRENKASKNGHKATFTKASQRRKKKSERKFRLPEKSENYRDCLLCAAFCCFNAPIL